jgi:hypothetical protein
LAKKDKKNVMNNDLLSAFQNVDVRRATWDEVFKGVNQAVEKYRNDSDSGPNGNARIGFRKLGHKLSRNADVMKQWLSLLPNGDYGSSIAAVFQMVATSAQRMSDTRDCIYETMADIPDIIRHSTDYIEIYRVHRSDHLGEKTSEMFEAVVKTLRHIIDYFMDSSFGKLKISRKERR